MTYSFKIRNKGATTGNDASAKTPRRPNNLDPQPSPSPSPAEELGKGTGNQGGQKVLKDIENDEKQGY